MPYVFSMTARMATIAASCILLLCVLLFLLGVEIGARYVAPAAAPAAPAAPPVSEHVPSPAAPDASAPAAPASNAS
jgi:hypothetical protein